MPLDPRILADPWYLAATPFLPLVIAFIVNQKWSASLKALVALFVCAVFSIVICIHAGVTQGLDIVTAFFLVLTVVKVTYEAVWKPLQIAPAIEKATSPGS